MEPGIPRSLLSPSHRLRLRLRARGTFLHSLDAAVFPEEIFLEILLSVDVVTLVKCASVCKLFHSMITSISILEYFQLLHLTDKTDRGSLSSLPIPERLSMLRRHQHTWDTFRWTRFRSFAEIRTDLTWVMTDGVFLRSSDAVLQLKELPSSIRNIGEKNWTLDFSRSRISECSTSSTLRAFFFAMDPTQDLLVADGVSPDCRNAALCLHFRSLSTGGLHPKAGVSHMNFLLDMQVANEVPEMKIYHDIVAFRTTHRYERHSDDEDYDPNTAPVYTRVGVLNWRTGQLLSEMHGEEIGGFAFLDRNTLLLGLYKLGRRLKRGQTSKTNYSPALMAWNFVEDSVDDHHWKRSSAFHRFLYPPVFRYLVTRVELDPAAPPTAPTGSSSTDKQNVPFYTSEEASDLLVCASIQFKPKKNSETVYIPAALHFILRSILLRFVSATSASAKSEIAWKKWGPRDTRMIPADYQHSPPNEWMNNVFGSRFVDARHTPTVVNEEGKRRPMTWKERAMDGALQEAKVEGRMALSPRAENEPLRIVMYDFNQRAVRKDLGRAGDESPPSSGSEEEEEDEDEEAPNRNEWEEATRETSVESIACSTQPREATARESLQGRDTSEDKDGEGSNGVENANTDEDIEERQLLWREERQRHRAHTKKTCRRLAELISPESSAASQDKPPVHAAWERARELDRGYGKLHRTYCVDEPTDWYSHLFVVRPGESKFHTGLPYRLRMIDLPPDTSTVDGILLSEDNIIIPSCPYSYILTF